MTRLGGLLIFGLLLGSASGWAEEAIKAKAKPVANLKTEYSIYGDYVTTTTTVEKTNAYNKMIDGPLFESLQKTLKNMAFVTSVVQTPPQKTSEITRWTDYETIKAKSNAFVVLSFNAPITLLFSIEETWRKCIVGKPVVADEMGSSSTCKGESSVSIKGPLAVYGNFATAVNVDALLRDKSELDMTLAKSWSGDDTTLTTKFNIKTPSFDSSLARFFRVLNIPVFTTGQDVSLDSGSLVNSNPLTSRQTLLLGIGRIIRQNHERMLLP